MPEWTSLALFASVLMSALAFGPALVLLRGSKDWRFGLLVALTALMSAGLALYLIGVEYYFEDITLSSSEEFLGVSAAALGMLAVVLMERCQALQKRVDEMRQPVHPEGVSGHEGE